MKRVPEYIISILVVGVIAYAFNVKADRDRLILTGKEILLELAPVDPLSLLQGQYMICLLYTSPSPRDRTRSRMPSSA